MNGKSFIEFSREGYQYQLKQRKNSCNIFKTNKEIKI